MSLKAAAFLVALLTIVSDSRAQQRSPHGLAYENPVAFSPSAYEFFHPDGHDQQGRKTDPCTKSSCSPSLPMAAYFESNQAHESRATASSQRHGGIGAEAVAGIVSGFVFAALPRMGAYYYMATKRRANMDRARTNSV